MRGYQRYIRNQQIERAKKLLNNIDPETYKKGPHDVTRFIKHASNRKSGETATNHYLLDENLLKEKEKYDGFNIITTNLEIHVDSKLMRDDVAQILTSLNTIYPLSGLDHKYYLLKDLNKKCEKFPFDCPIQHFAIHKKSQKLLKISIFWLLAFFNC